MRTGVAPGRFVGGTPFLFLAACFLAYSNGANDNFKGVASLYGSNTSLLAVGNGVDFAALQKGFLLPLLLSPIVAIILAAVLHILLRFIRISLGVEKEWCAYIGSEERVLAMPQSSSAIARQIIAPD